MKLVLYLAASQKGGSKGLAQQGGKAGKLSISSILRISRKLYLIFHQLSGRPKTCHSVL